MSSTVNLLVELFVEELPPKALKKLGRGLCRRAGRRLKGAGPGRADAASRAYATPRRLAVHMAQVASRPPTRPAAEADAGAVALDAAGASRRRRC
jgi:glycyl-tRNA synthetase beta chain